MPLLPNQEHENPQCLGCLTQCTELQPHPIKGVENLNAESGSRTWGHVRDPAEELGVHTAASCPCWQPVTTHTDRGIACQRNGISPQCQGPVPSGSGHRGAAGAGQPAVGLTGAPGPWTGWGLGVVGRGGMHKSGEQHTLTALSPKMSSFFISSVTRMSWRRATGDMREVSASTHGWAWAHSGRGGAYRHTFRLAVGLEWALAVHEVGVVEVDGGRLPLPLLDRERGWARGGSGSATCPSLHGGATEATNRARPVFVETKPRPQEQWP